MKRTTGPFRQWAALLAPILRQLAASEAGVRAAGFLGILVSLSMAVNGLNVLNSFVGRDVITSLEQRNRPDFLRAAVLYIGVFAIQTVVAVTFRFSEERLGLLWRDWLTRRLLVRYLLDRTYFQLKAAGTITNPDQRITEDVRSLTTTSLSFFLMVLNAGLSIVGFSGVLWSIHPQCFVYAAAYAVVGTFLTVKLGRPLIRFNYEQLDREAELRAGLVHVSENADSIALSHWEQRIGSRLLGRLDSVTANLRRIIATNRSLGVFTTGYNYLIQIIPILIVAPLFMRGEVEFGAITQAVMAFSALVGAFSLVVTQFSALSSYAAVVERVAVMVHGLDPAERNALGIETREESGRLAWESLTLQSPRDGQVLVRELSVEIPRGTRALVRSSVETARVALLRATAGTWSTGHGCVVRPSLEGILFLPERPYIPPGTLCELLLPMGRETNDSNAEILRALQTLEIETIVTRAGGLDTERDWEDFLSLGEQQLLGCARLILAQPEVAFLDRIGGSLSADQIERVFSTLAERSITVVVIDDGKVRSGHYDFVLDLLEGGAWRWRSAREAAIDDSQAM